MEPDVILMDEPLSNLDALLRLEMRAELKGVLAESKTTTIYVTHDQVEAMSLADRISVMHQGQIVQAAAPIEVYRNPAARFVASFIGNPPMNFLPATPAGSGQWTVAGETFSGPKSTEAKLEFAIRPEDLRPADHGLTAKVRRRRTAGCTPAGDLRHRRERSSAPFWTAIWSSRPASN